VSSAPPPTGRSASEHRQHPRELVCVAIEVAPDDADKHVAIIHDMSVGGAYVHARAPVPEGETVTLSIRLPTEEGARFESTTGEVVRVDPLPAERADVWSYGIAIRFHEPLVHLGEEIEGLAATLRRTGVSY
jgi:hypothetical protein